MSSVPFLSDTIKVDSKRYKEAVAYGAHLSAMLREACGILERMETTVDVSESLAFWWEMEKRKRGVVTDLVSSDGTPIRRRVGPNEGSDVDQPESGTDPTVVREEHNKENLTMTSPSANSGEVMLEVPITEQELQEAVLNSFPEDISNANPEVESHHNQPPVV